MDEEMDEEIEALPATPLRAHATYPRLYHNHFFDHSWHSAFSHEAATAVNTYSVAFLRTLIDFDASRLRANVDSQTLMALLVDPEVHMYYDESLISPELITEAMTYLKSCLTDYDEAAEAADEPVVEATPAPAAAGDAPPTEPEDVAALEAAAEADRLLLESFLAQQQAATRVTGVGDHARTNPYGSAPAAPPPADNAALKARYDFRMSDCPGEFYDDAHTIDYLCGLAGITREDMPDVLRRYMMGQTLGDWRSPFPFHGKEIIPGVYFTMGMTNPDAPEYQDNPNVWFVEENRQTSLAPASWRYLHISNAVTLKLYTYKEKTENSAKRKRAGGFVRHPDPQEKARHVITHMTNRPRLYAPGFATDAGALAALKAAFFQNRETGFILVCAVLVEKVSLTLWRHLRDGNTEPIVFNGVEFNSRSRVWRANVQTIRGWLKEDEESRLLYQPTLTFGADTSPGARTAFTPVARTPRTSGGKGGGRGRGRFDTTPVPYGGAAAAPAAAAAGHGRGKGAGKGKGAGGKGRKGGRGAKGGKGAAGASAVVP